MASGSACDSGSVVESYVRHRLRGGGGGGGGGASAHEDARESVHRAVREAGDELQRLYRPELAELSKRLCALPPDPERRRCFLAVADELFRDGVNWGRVLAFLEFGAAVCAQPAPADGDLSACAENVARWMTDYLNGPLSAWIQDNGGWDGFVELYSGQKNSVFSGSWPSLATSVLSLAALGAVGLTIGAYLAQK